MADEAVDVIEQYTHDFQDDGCYTCLLCGECMLVHRLARRVHEAEQKAAGYRRDIERMKAAASPPFGARPVF